MGRTLLLSGKSGAGKSTLAKALFEKLQDRAGGFYTEEIFGPGGRKGFRLIPAAGKPIIAAHVERKSRTRIGRYGVDVDAIDRAARSIKLAIEQKQIVLIDEIAQLQMFSSNFQSAVVKAISSPAQVIAMTTLEDWPWLVALKSLPNVTTWELTLKNRSKMVSKIMDWLETGI